MHKTKVVVLLLAGAPLAIALGVLSAVFVNAKPVVIDPARRCRANLQLIRVAKDRWAVDNKKAKKAVPGWDDLVGKSPYLRQKQVCPVGGTITINAIGTPPSCSIHAPLTKAL